MLQVTEPSRSMDVWKTITIGGSRRAPQILVKNIKERGMRIHTDAQDFINSKGFSISEDAFQVDLVSFSTEELNLPNTCSYEQICNKAIDLNLQLCPAEVGPELRRSYLDQPNGEWAIIAMNAVPCSRAERKMFFVVRADPSLVLYMGYIYPGCVWKPTDKFVFIKEYRKITSPWLSSEPFILN